MDRLLRWISKLRKKFRKQKKQVQLRLDLKERDEELEFLRNRVEFLEKENERLDEELQTEQCVSRIRQTEIKLLSAVHASDVQRWKRLGDKEEPQE